MASHRTLFVKKAGPPSRWFGPVLKPRPLQRKCACGGTPGPTGECEECRRKRLNLSRGRSPIPTPAETPRAVHEVLRSAGQPLDVKTRAFMEQRFGHDFSQVRVHIDATSAESARAIHALAYTSGQHVVFGERRYTPETYDGRRLLAHELTHVLQQNQPVDDDLVPCQIDPPEGNSEMEAERVSEKVVTGSPLSGGQLMTVPRSIQRACNTDTGLWDFEYDGCSVPGWLQTILGIADKDNPAGGADTQFSNASHTGACDHHDECYQTCSSADGAKDECDKRFRQEMRDTCNRSKESPAVKADCLNWASNYFLGVSFGGSSAFSERQSQVCNCKPKPGDFPTPSSDERPA